MSKNRDDFRFWVTVVSVFSVTVGGCLVIWIWQGGYPRTVGPTMADAGAYGDSYGYVNSLLSSLALAGAIAAIFLQTLELRYQRKELQESQDTWKSQSKALLLSGMLQGIAATAASRDVREHAFLVRQFTNMIAIELDKLSEKPRHEIVGRFTDYSLRFQRMCPYLDPNDKSHTQSISELLSEGSKLLGEIKLMDGYAEFREKSVQIQIRYEEVLAFLALVERPPERMVNASMSKEFFTHIADETEGFASLLRDRVAAI